MGDNGTCAAAATDGKAAQELLVEFERTGRQEPFAEIARRYAGMVYNVAYQVTRDAHDAEDATQATFLTLAVHAKTAGKIRYVGPWLRKVSHRLALDIRRSKKRRKAREEKHVNGNGNGQIIDLPVSNGMQMEELRHILREELDKLPAKYRMPLILYYFGGLSPDEMGKELSVNTSTLGVRLHRGRKMLAESLSGRGITMSAVAVGAMLAGLIDSFVRDNLIHSATHAAVQVAARGMIPDGAVASMPVMAAIHSATSALRLSRIKGIIAASILVATTLAGAGEVIKKYDLLDPQILQKLNLLRFVRPMIDRMLHVPKLTAQSDEIDQKLAVAAAATNANLNGVALAGSDWSFSLQPSNRSAISFGEPLIGGFANSTSLTAIANVSSQRLASGYDFAPASRYAAYVTPPTIAHAQTSTDVSSLTIRPQPVVATTAVAQISPLFDAPALPTSIGSGDAITIDNSTTSAIGPVATLTQGDIETRRMVVGESGFGSFMQTGGHLQASEAFVVAEQPGSNGSFQISGEKSLLDSPKIVIGDKGSASVKQDGGAVVATNASHTGQIVVADAKGSTGSYTLNGGLVYADRLTVGNSGSGSIQQNGGTAAFNSATLGQNASGAGTWTVDGGVITIASGVSYTSSDSGAVAVALTAGRASPVPPPTPTIVVGGQGAGTVVLASNSAGGTIQEQSGIKGSTLLVRSSQDGSGTFRGFGTVRLSGPFVQNGVVVADGGVLDFSAASLVSSTIENPIGSSNGWYARNGGELVLPPVKISGPYTFTWGEERRDHVLDLVNSVRFTPHGKQATLGHGAIDIALVDPLSSNAPAMPGGLTALSLWKLDSTVDLSWIDLTVRYDDLAVASAGLSSNDLAMWVYSGNSWQALTNGNAGIDPANGLLWASASGVPSYFAVADATPGSVDSSKIVPEPASLLSMSLIGAGSLLLRRRRR